MVTAVPVLGACQEGMLCNGWRREEERKGLVVNANSDRQRRGQVGQKRHRNAKIRKRAVAVALCLSCTGVLAACGSSTSPRAKGTSSSAAPAKVKNVVWWNMWSGNYIALTKHWADLFNATHSDIHVTVLNVPSADGDAKLLSSVAAGDPPDVFTEWNPVLGEYASRHDIESLGQFMTGKYAGLKSWLYPEALKGGMFDGNVYAIPMSMNAFALYYNKAMLHGAGIKEPPRTLSELDADQAKEWKIAGGRVSQIGFYPLSIGNVFELFSSYFNVTGFTKGKYDLAQNKQAVAEMRWLASYDKYPYSAVSAFVSAYGGVPGGGVDPFAMGREGFYVQGPWEGLTNIPKDNPSMEHNYGVEPFPEVPGGAVGPSTWVNGNYNIIPRGAKHPKAAFTFMAWLAGYDNVSTIAKILPTGSWIPASPKITASATYQKWAAAHPDVKTFFKEFESSSSRVTSVTPGEAEYLTALNNAVEEVATRKMTPMQALEYVDKHANKALSG